MSSFAKNIKVLLHAPEWIPYTLHYAELSEEIYKIQNLLINIKISDTSSNKEELVAYEVEKLSFHTEKQIESIESFYKLKEKTFAERYEKLIRALEMSGDSPIGSNTMRTLHTATLELYRSLMLLENFSIVNETAINKILAKYKKICQKDDHLKELSEIIKSYPAKITALLDNTTFTMRMQCKNMAEEIERFFQFYFMRGKSTDEQGRSAQMILRHRTKATTPVKGSRTLSWAWGIFGAFLVIFSRLALFVVFEGGAVNQINSADKALLMSTFLFSLMFLLYALARSSFAYRLINAPFIFELSPGRYIRPEKLLLSSSILLLVWSILAQTMLAAGLFEAGLDSTILFPRSLANLLGIGPSSSNTRKVPIVTCICGSVIWFICLILLPPWPYPHKMFPKHTKIGHFFVIFNRARNRYANDALSGLRSPFLHIRFTHFFLADLATSLEPALKSLLIALVNIHRWFGRSSKTVSMASLYPGMFALLPSWVRYSQCARRLYDASFETPHPHLYNSMKYQSRFIQFFAWAILIYPDNLNLRKRVAYTIFTLYSQLFKLYWDIFEDWGYMRKIKIQSITISPSQNPHRNRSLSIAINSISAAKNKRKRKRDDFKKKLIRRYTNYPFFYYLIIPILDTLIRLASIVPIWLSGGTKSRIETFLALLEVLRRGFWMLFRVENEHVTNVGQFRATLNVPLPFDTEVREAKDLKNSGHVLETHVITNTVDPTITFTNTVA